MQIKSLILSFLAASVVSCQKYGIPPPTVPQQQQQQQQHQQQQQQHQPDFPHDPPSVLKVEKDLDDLLKSVFALQVDISAAAQAITGASLADTANRLTEFNRLNKEFLGDVEKMGKPLDNEKKLICIKADLTVNHMIEALHALIINHHGFQRLPDAARTGHLIREGVTVAGKPYVLLQTKIGCQGVRGQELTSKWEHADRVWRG